MLTLDATNARIPNSEKYCTVPIVVPKMCTVKQSYNTHSNSQYLVSPSLLPLVQMGVLSTGLHKWVPKRYILRYVLYSIFGFKQQQNTDCSSLKDCQHFFGGVCTFCQANLKHLKLKHSYAPIPVIIHPRVRTPSSGQFREPVKDGADAGVDTGKARHPALLAPADQSQQLVVGPGPPRAHCSKRQQQQIVWIVFLHLSLQLVFTLFLGQAHTWLWSNFQTKCVLHAMLIAQYRRRYTNSKDQ